MATLSKINHIFVILCGGTGPRLWPLSTTSNPKQFLSILSPDSLLTQTIKRLLQITDKNNIYITTTKHHLDKINSLSQQLITLDHILVEPDKKNTALAIYFTLNQLKNLPPNTVISFMPADHYISPISKFKNDLTKSAQIAFDNNSLVTIGLHPTFPNPSFGYILPKNKFVEKPTKITALKYIINGALWNSGIYTATIKTYLSEFFQYFPKPNYKTSLSISFDKAISEKTKNLAHIKASFDWSDIGEWGSIFTKSKSDNNNIAIINQNTQYLSQNSNHCLVSSENPQKLIGLVGVKNLAIIDTPEALLVSSLDQSSQVRDLVTNIVKNPKLKHFFVNDQK